MKFLSVVKNFGNNNVRKANNRKKRKELEVKKAVNCRSREAHTQNERHS